MILILIQIFPCHCECVCVAFHFTLASQLGYCVLRDVRNERIEFNWIEGNGIVNRIYCLHHTKTICFNIFKRIWLTRVSVRICHFPVVLYKFRICFQKMKNDPNTDLIPHRAMGQLKCQRNCNFHFVSLFSVL